jgi:glycosyltransferase involved in cell wall biosynthesis
MVMKVINVINIGYVIPYFFGDQFDYLKNNGGIKSYVACKNDTDFIFYNKKYNLDSVTLPINRKLSLIDDLKCVFKLYRFIKKEKIDIIVGHTPKGGYISVLTGLLVRKKVIYVRHGLVHETASGLVRLIFIAIEKINSSLSSKTICVSPSVKNVSLDLKLGKKHKNIILNKGTFNGIDTAYKFNPNRLSPTNGSYLSFGFIGRFAKDKGLIELIDAWRKINLDYPNCKLIIAGYQDERDPIPNEYLNIIEKNSINISYLGKIKDQNFFYSKINVLILPSYREGFPTVVLEASSLKKAIITTKVTGCVDSIIENKTGLFCNINSDSIQNSIQFFVNNPAKVVEFGENGRNFVVENFDEKILWNNFIKILKDE